MATKVTEQEERDDARLARMESGITAVASQLGTYIDVSEKNDRERRDEIKLLWTELKDVTKAFSVGLKEQGDHYSTNLEKQAERFSNAQNRNELTGGKIIAFCTFLLLVAATAVGMNNAYMGKWFEKVDAQFKEIGTHRMYSERDRIDIREDIKAKVAVVDHDSELRHVQQQILVDRGIREATDHEIRIRAMETEQA